jgi:predicted transcriptional regulator
MIRSLVDILFGCSHTNYSFPQTVKSGQRRSEAASVTGTYVVCLSCGKEFPYDWRNMKVVAPEPQQRPGKLAEVIRFARKNAA